LHHHGIEASEGELAYLAGTSLLGTDAWSIARAITFKARCKGLRGQYRRTNYDTVAAEQSPFIAHVRWNGYGHAVVVEELDGDAVMIIDPLHGERKTIARRQFEKTWDGTAISLRIAE